MLNVTLNDWKKWDPIKEHTVALFVFEDQVPPWAKADGFKGKELDTLLYHPKDSLPTERVLLIGLGKKADFSSETLRRAAAKVLRGAEALGLEKISARAPQVAKSPAALAAEFQALAEGLYLATYRFDRHKTPAPDAPKPVQEVAVWLLNSNRAIQDAVEKAEVYSRATTLARDLINEPPSRMNPERLAKEAVQIAKTPISVHVYET